VPAGRATRPKQGAIGETLRIAGFQRLFGELQDWRISLEPLKSPSGAALVLPFVKGLRLSAQLIYILREDLSATELEVDWGHLLDENDRSCSPECDIIIHRTGHVREWDGSNKPVMDFKFVRGERAVGVISCKSFARGVDADYVRKLRPYVKHVFLFVECCPPDKVASLQRKAKDAGYAGFGYLYTFDEKSSESIKDERAWLSFLDAVKSRVMKAMRSR
jgi:hypothetical protein